MGNLSSFGGSSAFSQLPGMGGITGGYNQSPMPQQPPSLGQPQMVSPMQPSGSTPPSSAVGSGQMGGGPSMTQPTQLGGNMNSGAGPNQMFGSK